MIWILATAFIIVTTGLYTLGGQTLLWTRRYLMPPLQAALIFFMGSGLWISICPLLYIGVWDLGEKWIRKIVPIEPIINAIYGFVATIPLIIAIGIIHTHWWELSLIAPICGLFAINFGSWGKIGIYDILGSDIVRSGILSISWLIVILVK